MQDAACVILAGGQSRRMGRDKAMLEAGKETFLGRLIREYGRELPVYVSVARPGQFVHPGAGEIVDCRPGMGPLAGLEAAFLQTVAERVFLTATDLPFGTLALAKELLSRMGNHDACVIRRKDGSPEPAFGIYGKACLEPVQSLLDGNRRAMRGLLERVDAVFVEEASLSGFDLDRILWNINTPEAYEKALELL